MRAVEEQNENKRDKEKEENRGIGRRLKEQNSKVYEELK